MKAFSATPPGAGGAELQDPTGLKAGVSRPGRFPRLIRKQGLERALDSAVRLFDNRFITYLPLEPATGRPAPADVPPFILGNPIRGSNSPTRGSTTSNRGSSSPDPGSTTSNRESHSMTHSSATSNRGSRSPDHGLTASNHGSDSMTHGSTTSDRGSNSPDHGSTTSNRGSDSPTTVRQPRTAVPTLRTAVWQPQKRAAVALSGLWDPSKSRYLGLAPQATCLSSFGASSLNLPR
jgi:hypothetical protein